MEFNLSGKVALVSGCSQGLGYACVLALAKQGADIYGVSIGDDSALKQEVEQLGKRYHSLTISLTTPGAIHDLLKDVYACYGRIDILLNFASVMKKEDTLSITREAMKQAFDINVHAAFSLSQEVIKKFREQGHGGKIINAGGVFPLNTSEYSAYYISKGALAAMTRYLAYEFGKDDIQVNSITFGFMTSGTRLQGTKSNDMDESIRQHIPARRWGTYKDAEGLVVLLASAHSNYITGACIPVDGGYSIQ